MNYFYFTVAVVVYCFTKCSLEKTRAAGKAREPTRPRHCRHKLDWQSEGWCEEKRKIWFFKRESVALKKSCVTLQSLLAWSSLALPLGNRLESGCNIVFTHGARRAKVARSLIDARGVRMTHAEARLDPTNPPPLRIRSPRGPPWGGDHRSQVPCSWDIWT